MKRIVRVISTAVAACGLMAIAATEARAAIILDSSPSVIYQQTESSPCVIGGENCLNGDFPYTVQLGGAEQVYDEFSPVYEVGDITDVVGGSTFTIALDYNDTVAGQTLYEFNACYYDAANTLISCDSFTLDTLLKTNNNGVGFSDFLLTGFVIPDGTAFVQFEAEWFGNDGPDRYFLVGEDAEEFPPIPEPATVTLFGLGLLGIARRVARRNG